MAQHGSKRCVALEKGLTQGRPGYIDVAGTSILPVLL